MGRNAGHIHSAKLRGAKLQNALNRFHTTYSTNRDGIMDIIGIAMVDEIANHIPGASAVQTRAHNLTKVSQ